MAFRGYIGGREYRGGEQKSNAGRSGGYNAGRSGGYNVGGGPVQFYRYDKVGEQASTWYATWKGKIPKTPVAADYSTGLPSAPELPIARLVCPSCRYRSGGDNWGTRLTTGDDNENGGCDQDLLDLLDDFATTTEDDNTANATTGDDNTAVAADSTKKIATLCGVALIKRPKKIATTGDDNTAVAADSTKKIATTGDDNTAVAADSTKEMWGPVFPWLFENPACDDGPDAEVPADYKTKKWQHHGKAKAQAKVKAKDKAKGKAKGKDYNIHCLLLEVTAVKRLCS